MFKFFFILLLLSVFFCEAQLKKTDTLKEVIVSNNVEKNTSNVETIATPYIEQQKQNSVSQLLHLHSNVFVKNYGIGVMNTISMRGNSAAQTEVMWNGIYINNAFSGISDFSIFPVVFFDKIQVDNNILNINNVGGLISMQSDVQKQKKSIDIGWGYESFRNHISYLTLKNKIKNWTFGVRYTGIFNKNQYEYYNNSTQSYDTLFNANSSVMNSMLHIAYQKVPNKSIALHSWFQNIHRTIPAADYEWLSNKNITNVSIKNAINIKIIGRHVVYKNDIGFVSDRMHYNDSILKYYNTYHYFQASSHQQAQIILPKNFILHTHYLSQLQFNRFNIQQAIFRNIFTLNIEKKLQCSNTILEALLQVEQNNHFSLPLLYGFQFKQPLLKNSTLFAGWKKSYRVPTLNELYFEPGGNRQLKPENGKHFEAGLDLLFKYDKHLFKSKTTYFYRQVNDWIVWFGGNILTPHNLQKVQSRGWDLHWKYHFITKEYNHKNNYLFLEWLHTYTIATSLSSYIPNDYSIGKQIPYVPRYQTKFIAGYQNTQFNIHYILTYTGYRFITTDETQFLNPFTQHHIYLNKKIQLKTHKLFFTFAVNNLLGVYYESMPGRTMPGRNFAIGFSYNQEKY